MYWDYHTHSEYSADSRAPLSAMVAAAEARGLREYCFTDHYEPDYPHLDLADFTIDIPAYAQGVEAFLRAYDGRVALKRGIEVGLMPGIMPRVEDELREHDWDFVIASQHLIGGKDPYFKQFFTDMPLARRCEIYLTEMLDALRSFDYYNVVGHITYAQRWYNDADDCVIAYADCAELADELLRHIIHTGHGIEVNTSSIATRGVPMPGWDFLKRYRELGGEVLTMGSDAHRPEQVARQFDVAVEGLKALGFCYLTTFQGMQPQMVALP